MKVIRTAFASLLLVSMVIAAYAQEYKKSVGYVNDFAHLLSADAAKSLNDELIAFEKKTTVEIAVVTVGSLDGKSVEAYTQTLATTWGVGKRDKNNGIVFLVAPNERKMRIEVASGMRSVLTDSRVARIRDGAVLPRFKAGNMAQGVIDGTHAIMRTVDTSSAAGSLATSSVSDGSREWTDEDTKLFLSFFGGSVGALIILLFVIVPQVRRFKARKYVLKNKGAFAERLKEEEGMADKPGVSKGTHQELKKLKGEFSLIDRLSATSRNVDWIKTREKLDSLDYSLDCVASAIKEELAFAREAQKKGPALMKKIPAMIKAAEKKLAKGKHSARARAYLEGAQRQYAQAQSQQHSGMTIVDWAILYVILNSIQSNTAKAESTHESVNTDRPSDSDSSRSSDDSASSSGAGDSSGFGGGGGFDGGGGASGSW